MEDERRKDCVKLVDANKKLELILYGLFLPFRLNSDDNVRDLLRVFDSPVISAQHLARSVRHYLYAVLDKDSFSGVDSSEDDILSLALSDVVNHKDLGTSITVDGYDHGQLDHFPSIDLGRSTSPNYAHNGSTTLVAGSLMEPICHNKATWMDFVF